MKYSNPYLIAGILVLLVIGQSYAASGQTTQIANHVVINEVELNPVGDYTKLPVQWVELYNPTSSPVTIGGWSIGATSGLKQAYAISLGTTIQPQQFIVYHYVPLWLPQAGAVIQLTGSDGTIIDQTPPLTDTQGDGNTWQRTYDGYNTGSQSDWVYKSGTPGSSNGSPPTTSVTSQLTMSVSTDKQNYIFGDIVNIDGQVSQIVPNIAVTSIPTTVNLVVSGPNGFKQTFSLYPGTDFKFSTYMKTDQVLGFTEGIYTISASYGGIQTSSTFSLGSAAFVPPAQIAPTTMVISTDRSNYTVSEPIILTGTVSTVIPLTPVQFKVYDPTNVVVYQGTIFPDSQGKLTTVNAYQSSAGSSGLLINGVNPIYGIYRVAATYGGTSAFTTFVLSQAQIQSQPILVTTDKKVYAPGDTVTITGSTQLHGLQNSGLSPTVDIIQVSYTNESRSVPVSFHVTSFVNVQSDNSFTYQFTIPAISDRIGNYGVTVTSPFGTAYTTFVVSANPSTYVAVNNGPFSMSTDKSSYVYGDSILISGQVRPDLISSTGAAQVMISLFNSTGGQVYSQTSFLSGSSSSQQSTALAFSALPDVNGYYSLKQNVIPNIFSVGTYTLVAHFGASLQTSTSFSVSNPLNGSASNPISVSTDKNVYGIGNTVQLNGQIASSVGTDSYTLTLVKPSGNIITFPLQVTNGLFSWNWIVPQTDTSGSAVITTDRSASSVVDLTRTVYGIYRITISSAHASTGLFFQVSNNPQPNQSLSPLTVVTDKTNYLSTDVASIWGQVIPPQNAATAVANSIVAVTVYQNGQQAYQGTATVNQGGQYYITIPFHPGIWTNGTYNLYAQYLGNQVTTSFNVSDPFSTSSGGLRVIMITDSDKYLPGQTVLITGRTSSIVSIQNVDLAIGMTNDTTISEGQVTSLTGITIPSTTVPFDQYGSFSYDYKIPSNAKLGNYTIVAQVPFGAFNAYFNVVNQLPSKILVPIVTNQTQTTPTNVTSITSIPTTIPSTIGPVEKPSQSTNMFISKTNQIPDSVIPITLGEKSVAGMTYYPRQLDGLLRVNPGNENDVSIKVSSQNGTCVIGQDSNCIVSQSTVQPSLSYRVVMIDGKDFLVGYSGTGLRLQQFSIMPAIANDVMPDGQWTVDVIKKDQVTRFYYQVTYVGK
ncbi:lamin tail domain-containing protein [Candidatus Nitrosotalea bavarica]|uniref:lamin tail domain-containing protein n=1 Tax=Candidatus Nitrosotalea bavarica TaxID=1903277 RepID=UPI0013FE353A|nr:lamin tail domain-containing protein [Candidatus Nitrosotalea bavarica]